MNWRSRPALTKLGKELFQEIKEDRVTQLAAAFAYHTVFAIPALIILTLTVAALIDSVTSVQVTEHLRNLIQDRAPAETKAVLNTIVDHAISQVGGGGASLGLILTAALALWSGSNAVGALVESFNTAYGVDEGRPFLKKRLVVLGLTLLLALLINLAFALLVFGKRIGSWIADRANLGSAFDVTWNVARWPLAILAIAFILAVLYYAGPDVDQSFRWISPGSLFATLLWLIATAGFGIYLHFSNPGSAYGVLGGVLVLLFFLYVTGLVFLVGAELNALLGRQYDPATVQDLATRPDTDSGVKAEAQRRLPEARAKTS